jgi:NAD(P)-dependent dehydrogenase (short-subunit alcohol dehydrogenase family)
LAERHFGGRGGRFGADEDVACCAAVLAADEAGYLTAQILDPSGGWVMR